MSIQELVCVVYSDAPGAWTFRVTKVELEKNDDAQLGALLRARMAPLADAGGYGSADGSSVREETGA